MNKHKVTPFIIGLSVLVVAVIIVFAQHSKKKTQATTTTDTTSSSTDSTKPTGGTTVSSYTMATVAQHNKQADCWTTINGGVYNVTSWIHQHPGGAQAIIGLCGIDGSAAFNGQHGGQARPASELASFKIGTLTK